MAEQKTKMKGFRQYPKRTLFVGVLLALVFLGIVRLIGDATNKKSTSPAAVTARVDETQMWKPIVDPSATVGNEIYHAPARDITEYPGMNNKLMSKVVINATLVTTDRQLAFTNNESQDWKFCYVTINTASGPSKWYAYDFYGIPAGQTYTVQWSWLLREDGTPYTNVSREPKIIQLSCVLDDNYDFIGFAKFHYTSLGVAQQQQE